MLGRLLFLAFIVLPLIEIALFIVIGQAIGLWPTLAGVIVMAVLGSYIVRRQGLALLAGIRRTVGERQLPALTLADAMLVSVAGVLLAVPGYLTGAIGLILLIPPVRAALYRFIGRRMRTGGVGRASPTGPRTIELEADRFRPR